MLPHVRVRNYIKSLLMFVFILIVILWGVCIIIFILKIRTLRLRWVKQLANGHKPVNGS